MLILLKYSKIYITYIYILLSSAKEYSEAYTNHWYHHHFFHSNTNPVFGHVLIHYFDKTHVLVGTVELIWLLLLNILSFNFASPSNKFLLGWQDSEEAMESVLLSL